jgi:AraC family transcriptional regulator, arabinose operon regulatory protein
MDGPRVFMAKLTVMLRGAGFYFRPSRQPEPRALCVHALGIREIMPRGHTHHGGQGAPFLFMCFHSPAWLNPGAASQEQAAGGTIFWPPGAVHHYGHAGRSWTHSWINIDGEAVAAAVAQNRIPLGRLLRFDGERLFDKYLTLLHDELHGHVPPDPLVLEGITQVWLRETARALRGEGQGTELPERLQAVRRHMEGNLQQPLRLDVLAAMAHLSASQFSAVFKKHFGTSPLRFVHELRMKRAEMLLADENLLVYQVAERVGYPDALLFSKQFRRHFGISPRRFRQRRSMKSSAGQDEDCAETCQLRRRSHARPVRG